jgi:ABC-type transport system substrate-binding protein
MNALRPAGGLLAGTLIATLLVAACTSGAASSAPPSGAPSAVPSGDASQPPDAPVTSSPTDDTGQLPGPGGKLVVPRPGQLDVHSVPADSLAARVDGSTILVTATWTSGVEPCNVLDTILVNEDAGTFTITLREGHGPEEIACIAIAEQHRTEFEIPSRPPGTYTITDSGGLAAPIKVTVG